MFQITTIARISLCCLAGFAIDLHSQTQTPGATTPAPQDPAISSTDFDDLAARYSGQRPVHWGTKIPGVYARFQTTEPEIALTFDACRAGFDADMFAVLEREKVCATVFVAGPWLKLNTDAAKKLAASPWIEIENHGTNHRPLSVNGRGIYHLRGTQNPSEVIHEIEDNAKQIESLTGRRPRLFRPATGYCDDVAVRIANDLGYAVATFNVLGDEGATLTGGPMTDAIARASAGDIVIVHINHPRAGAAPALEKAIQQLRGKGFAFVKLGDRINHLRAP